MKELAEQLKSERLKRGLSLKTVSGKAGIAMGILQALENGNVEHIGTPFLVHSHLAAYAAALGIDLPSSLMVIYEE